MSALNDAVFLRLNAPAHPEAWSIDFATFLANDLIWLIPASMAISWLLGGSRLRKTLIIATAAGLLGLFLNQCIGFFWWSPRPFMVPIGHTFIPHAPDSSFPSDHLTLWWAVAFSIWTQRYRQAGVSLALMGLPVAWARIYLGVHFPLDMVGAALVALLSTRISIRTTHWYLAPTYSLTIKVYRRLFAPLIARGWVLQ